MSYEEEVAGFIQRTTIRIADLSERARNGGGPAGGERATDPTLRLSDFLVTLGDNVLPEANTLRLIHLLNDQLPYQPGPLATLGVSFLAPVTGDSAAPSEAVLVRLAVTGNPVSVQLLDGLGRSLGYAQKVGGDYRLTVTMPATLGLTALNARAVDARGNVALASVFVQVRSLEFGTVTSLDAQGDDGLLFLDAVAS